MNLNIVVIEWQIKWCKGQEQNKIGTDYPIHELSEVSIKRERNGVYKLDKPCVGWLPLPSNNSHSGEQDKDVDAFQIESTDYLYVNAADLPSNVGWLCEPLNANIAHHTGISETWLSQVTDQLLIIPSIRSFHNDQKKEQRLSSPVPTILVDSTSSKHSGVYQC